MRATVHNFSGGVFDLFAKLLVADVEQGVLVFILVLHGVSNIDVIFDLAPLLWNVRFSDFKYLLIWSGDHTIL
jgi:hypothetical protein